MWIENGIVKNLNYDRYWAQKQGVRPTRAGGGGGFGGGAAVSACSVATTLDGRDDRVAPSAASSCTRFWYIRRVDPRTMLYTGLTRDGTFLIENGKITHPVKNFRFNESPIFMLNNLEMLGPTMRVNASESCRRRWGDVHADDQGAGLHVQLTV